jgi:protein-tyrosine phosphatase
LTEEIFWIDGTSLAIVLRPRGGDWLEDELRRMKRTGIDTLVSLLEEDEAASLGLEQEASIAEQIAIRFLSYPIPDRTTPADTAAFREFAGKLANLLRAGKYIGVHCRGSIGRATVTAASTLIQLGWDPKAALTAIETARGCPVPDTPEQREWILNYKAIP